MTVRSRPVLIAASGQGAADAVMSIAVEAGLFDEIGLRVEVVTIAGGPVKVAEALAAGRVSYAVIPASAAMRENLKESKIRLLVSFVGSNAQRVIARRTVQSGHDLAGGAVGCTARASQEEIVLRHFLTGVGLEADRDVRIRELGARDKLWEALVAGSIDALASTAPLAFKAEEEGFPVFRPHDADLPYQLGALAAGTDVIAFSPDEVRRVVRATVRGIRLFKNDPPLGIRHIATRTRVEDPVVVRRTYDAFNAHLTPRPYVRMSALEPVLRDLVDVLGLPLETSILDDLVDDRFLTELERDELPLL